MGKERLQAYTNFSLYRFQAQGHSQSASEELSEILKEFTSSELALKQDLKELEYALKSDLEKTRGELQKEIKGLDINLQDTKADLQKELRTIDLKISETNMKLAKRRWICTRTFKM